MPLISIGVISSTSIDKLDELLELLSNQTHQNIEILIANTTIPGPALIHHLRKKLASDFRIRYVPTEPTETEDAPLHAVLKAATGSFFSLATNTARWAPNFLERCVAEIGSHGSVMSATSVNGHLISNGLMGGNRRPRQDLLAFLRNPTEAIFLGMHRTHWIKSFVNEVTRSGNLSLTILRSVSLGHHRMFGECLCDLTTENPLELNLMPAWIKLGIEHQHASALNPKEKSPNRNKFQKAFFRLLGEKMLGNRDGSKKHTQYEIEPVDSQITSYSQSGEDVIINFIFKAIELEHPTYLDLGAHHPHRFSNTQLLYQKGSHGVNVEADPSLFAKFLTDRPLDINLNIGVGVGANGTLPFYIMSEPTLNTFSKEEADRCEKMGTHHITNTLQIQLRDVNEIIAENFDGNAPDFVTIDVEGLDFEILKSINLQIYRPAVICIETIAFSEAFDGIKTEDIGTYLIDCGYFLYADTWINSIFVDAKRWRQ